MIRGQYYIYITGTLLATYFNNKFIIQKLNFEKDEIPLY